MGGGAIATTGNEAIIGHLIDPNRKCIITLNAWIVLLLITSSTTGYDASMMNGLQSLAQWENYFHNPTGGKLGLLNAIQNIGSLAAYPMAPYLSDGLGRRPTIFIGALIMCCATVIQTASQSVGMFIGARFLIGFGLTFAANAAPMLVTEISYPTYRAPLTSAYNSLCPDMPQRAAWTTFGTFRIGNTWAWRIPSAIQALAPVLQVCLVWFCPESPRYLISKGKEAAALKTLAYYHADGDESLVRYEFEEIRAAIEFDRTVAANVGWKSLFTTPGNRKRMRIIIALGFFAQWSGNGLVSYYLNKVFDTIGITDPSTQLLINGILQIWNLFWALSAALLVDRIGRRILFMSSVLGMFVFFTFQTVCSALFAERGSNQAAHAVIAFIFLFYASYDLAFTPLIFSYTIEILPYQLRAKGFTIFSFIHSAALVFNQYVNPIALSNSSPSHGATPSLNETFSHRSSRLEVLCLLHSYIPHSPTNSTAQIVYVCWLAFEAVFLWLYVIETRNRTLEETATLFDGTEATKKIVGQAAHQVSDEKSSASFHENTLTLDKA
ncbi:hexose transporter [Infundibulicybe gibba]|nr:hexose transporter [Infundibulicybe gibba]